jgi:hypothetical protein
MALTLSEIQSTTQDVWMPSAVDNYYTANVLVYRMLKDADKLGGGEKIRQPIWYGKPIGGAFGNNTKFDTTKRSQINAARFDWAYFYEPVTYDIQDKVENSGEAQEIDIIMTKLNNAQKAIKESMANSLYGDGVASGDEKPITGLRAMINSTSSTSYGGITEDDLAEWAPGAVTTTTEALSLPVMRTLKTACKVGNDAEGGMPTLYITTDTLRDSYEALLQPQQRFSDPKLASAGFDNLLFNSKPVVGDTKCQSGFMYALNENYMNFKCHTSFNFHTEPWMRPTNEYKFTTQILWVGNLCCSRRSAHGYHSNLS